jgi:uncharacterized membrane protein YfcA
MPRLRQDVVWIGAPSLLGGGLGAYLVIRAGDAVFSHLVPWLILGATVLFIVQDPVRRWLAKRTARGPLPPEEQDRPPHPIGAMIFQFFVALYGGFFGAGIGIMMLAAMGMMGLRNIHHMNGLKNFAAVCINGVAAVIFILERRVHWPLAALMAVGAILGGYGGAGLARRLGQQNVRRFVIFVGLSIGLYTLLKETHLLPHA